MTKYFSHKQLNIFHKNVMSGCQLGYLRAGAPPGAEEPSLDR